MLSFCLFQLSMTSLNLRAIRQITLGPLGRSDGEMVPHLSLCGMSGFSSLSRATSVCMNLLNSVSFFRPPVLPFPARARRARQLLRCCATQRTKKYARFVLMDGFLDASAALCLPVVTTITRCLRAFPRLSPDPSRAAGATHLVCWTAWVILRGPLMGGGGSW